MSSNKFSIFYIISVLFCKLGLEVTYLSNISLSDALATGKLSLLSRFPCQISLQAIILFASHGFLLSKNHGLKTQTHFKITVKLATCHGCYNRWFPMFTSKLLIVLPIFSGNLMFKDIIFNIENIFYNLE